MQHVRRIIKRFRDTDSVCKGKSIGRHSVLTEEVVADVGRRMAQSPTKSLRQLSAQRELSYGSCQRTVKSKLHLHPYGMSVVQELLPPDYEKRREYCHWFNNNLNDDLLDLTFYSDEAWFHLTGYVNSQNYRTWSAENPHVFKETTLHPIKIGVWIAMSRKRIIGPIFFQDNINAANYQNLILQPSINQLHDDESQQGFFQQDNAPAHTAHTTIHFLQEYYDNRLISRNLWPPRSPELTPLNLFGYLKNTVYKNCLYTIEDLQEAILNAVNDISQHFTKCI